MIINHLSFAVFLLDYTGIKVCEDCCTYDLSVLYIVKVVFCNAPLECVKLLMCVCGLGIFFLKLDMQECFTCTILDLRADKPYNITCAGLERYCYYHWLELRPTWKLLSICRASHVGRLCTRQKYLFCGSPSQPLRWRVYSYCSAGVVKCFALG